MCQTEANNAAKVADVRARPSFATGDISTRYPEPPKPIRVSAATVLHQRSSELRAQATRMLNNAEALDKLARSADAYSGEAEEVLYRLVTGELY